MTFNAELAQEFIANINDQNRAYVKQNCTKLLETQEILLPQNDDLTPNVLSPCRSTNESASNSEVDFVQKEEEKAQIDDDEVSFIAYVNKSAGPSTLEKIPPIPTSEKATRSKK